MKHKMSALLRALIFAMVFSLVVSTAALAAGGFDANQTCGLSIRYSFEGVAVSEAKFSVYRVGELSEDGRLSLSGKFADYPVVVDGLDDESFSAAAETLYGYVQLDDVQADWELVTDGEGLAVLNGLTSGLYLLAGQPRVDEAVTYVTVPMLLALPYSGGDDWSYYVEILPKCYAEPTHTALKVLKVWDDKGREAARPAEITVKLLRDGEVAETVKLNAENNWRYIWEELEASATWTVVEEISGDYTVSVTREGVTYVITNTFKQPPPPPTPTPTQPPIPQTGLVWWPVPVLLLAGAVLIAVGFIGRKEDGDEG